MWIETELQNRFQGQCEMEIGIFGSDDGMVQKYVPEKKSGIGTEYQPFDRVMNSSINPKGSLLQVYFSWPHAYRSLLFSNSCVRATPELS